MNGALHEAQWSFAMVEKDIWARRNEEHAVLALSELKCTNSKGWRMYKHLEVAQVSKWVACKGMN